MCPSDSRTYAQALPLVADEVEAEKWRIRDDSRQIVEAIASRHATSTDYHLQ